MTEAPVLPLHARRHEFDPAPELIQLRDTESVTRTEVPAFSQDQHTVPAWLVTRYADVREVLADPSRFSNVNNNRPEDFNTSLLNMDPPDHTRLRRMLTGEFTVKRMRRLVPRIEAIVNEHLDAMQAKGSPADLVADFALPIPSLVICELLGVPYADRSEFQQWSALRLNLTQPFEERIAAVRKSREYMTGLVESKRADPDDDMIGMLIREHGDAVTDDELVAISDLLLLAGHETTSNMLGLGTLLLLQHPDQAALLRDDDGIVDQAVEELMRYLTVVTNAIPRFVAKDTELHGHQLRAGEMVICSLSTANRDPEVGDGSESFDITRKITSHLGFGHGIHHCLGAPLARMEMRVAFPALLRRFPGLRSELPVSEVPFREYSFVYGVEELPVSW